MISSPTRCTDDGGETGKCCTAFIHCGEMINMSPWYDAYRFYASSLHLDATSATQVTVYRIHASWDTINDNDDSLPLPRPTLHDTATGSIVPGAPVAVRVARSPSSGLLESCAKKNSTHCLLVTGISAVMEPCPSELDACDSSSGSDDGYGWKVMRYSAAGCNFGARGTFFSMACKDRNTGSDTDGRPFCFEDYEYNSIIDQVDCPSNAFEKSKKIVEVDVTELHRNARQLTNRMLKRGGFCGGIMRIAAKIAASRRVQQSAISATNTATQLASNVR